MSFDAMKKHNQLNNVFAFGFEIFYDAEKAALYAGVFYFVSKLNMEWIHDIYMKKESNNA